MKFTRRHFLKTASLFVPAAAYAATTVVVPPRSGGIASAPIFTPVGNPNNLNGNGSNHGNKHTRPIAGSTIDWGDPVTNGIVGCWLCNEGGGTTLYDIARGRNATLSGDTPDKYWGTGSLNGVLASGRGVTLRLNPYAEATNFSLGTNRVTVMVWAWYDPIGAAPWSGGNAAFVNKEPVNAEWSIAHRGSDNQILWQCGTGLNNAVLTPRPTDKIWHQIVGTFDGTTNALYVDGVSKGTSTPAVGLVSTTSALDFGRFGTVGGWAYYGDIGPIYIWNRALSAREVGELHALPYRFIY